LFFSFHQQKKKINLREKEDCIWIGSFVFGTDKRKNKLS
jgi:hypothetical protein